MSKYDYKIVELNFLAKFLKVLGLSPNLKYCIHCQSTITSHQKIFFDKTRGGFVCPKCHHQPTGTLTTQIFRAINVLSDLTLKEIIDREINTPIESRYNDIKKFFDDYIKQTEKYF